MSFHVSSGFQYYDYIRCLAPDVSGVPPAAARVVGVRANQLVSEPKKLLNVLNVTSRLYVKPFLLAF